MSQSQPQGANGELAESGVTIVAFAGIELARVRRALDAFMQQRRPPPHIRPRLDLGFRISGQSVEIFERRPRWRGPPDEKHESPVAKAACVRARNSARSICVAITIPLIKSKLRQKPAVSRIAAQIRVRGGAADFPGSALLVAIHSIEPMEGQIALTTECMHSRDLVGVLRREFLFEDL